jgi:hypothetical protein
MPFSKNKGIGNGGAAVSNWIDDGNVLYPKKNRGIANASKTIDKQLRIYALSGIDTLDQSHLTFDGASVLSDQWQSVTAGITGALSKVSVQNGSGITATNCVVTIYEGISSSGNVIAQESGLSFPHSVLIDVPLTIKPHLLNTDIFTIGVVGDNFDWHINTTGGYPGGSFKGTSSDAVFRTYIDTGSELALTDSGILLYTGKELNLANIPLSLYNLSAQQPAVTGDGTIYTMFWDNKNVDHGGNYNPGTGIFTVDVSGFYEIGINSLLGGIGSSHTAGFLYVITTANNYRPYVGNPANERNVSTNRLAINKTIRTYLAATDTVQCQLQVNGTAKTVSLDVVNVSNFYVKLLSTA